MIMAADYIQDELRKVLRHCPTTSPTRMVMYFTIYVVDGSIDIQQDWFMIRGHPAYIIPLPPPLPPINHFMEALTWEPDEVPYVCLDDGRWIGGPPWWSDTNVEVPGLLILSTTTTTNAGTRHVALAKNYQTNTPGPSHWDST